MVWSKTSRKNVKYTFHIAQYVCAIYLNECLFRMSLSNEPIKIIATVSQNRYLRFSLARTAPNIMHVSVFGHISINIYEPIIQNHIIKHTCMQNQMYGIHLI